MAWFDKNKIYTMLKDKCNSSKVFFKKNVKLSYKSIVMVIIGIIAISSIGTYCYKRIQQNKYKITSNAAEEYFYAGEYNKAVDEYKKILKNDKNLSLLNAKIGEVYSVKGDIETSRKYLKVSKDSLTSNDSKVWNIICFTEFMNKDYKEALIDGEKALKLNPSEKSLTKTMFTIYMANNELDKASKLVSSYKLDEKSAYDTAEFARMLMMMGKWEEGYSKLRKAWSIDKDEYKIYDVLAQTAVYNKDKLLQDITSLSTKNPKDAAYKMWIGKVYSLSPETAEQANSIMNTIASEDLGKIEVKLIKAAILQNMNQHSKGDSLISEVIKSYPDDYRVLHTAGWYYLNKKDYKKAEEYCKKSIVKNKNYPDNYGFLMPEILKAQNKSLEGEPYFRMAMYKEPYNYNIMLNIANYYWYTTKNTKKALEYFMFAEIVKPNDPEIKYNIATIYLSDKKEKEAIEKLKQCIKLDESTPKYHRTLGTIYLTQGNNNEAIKEIRFAYHADEQDILTLNNAGCYYVTVESNLEKGMYNLKKAEEGIKDSTDKYTRDTINENYNKVKKLFEDYNKGKSNEVIKIPNFVLFY